MTDTRSWRYGSYSYWPINGNAYPDFGTGEPVPHSLWQVPGWMPLIQDKVQDKTLASWAQGWKANHTTRNSWIAQAMEDVNPSNVPRRTATSEDVRGANIATFDLSVRWYGTPELRSAGLQPSWPQRAVYSVWEGN